MSGVEPRPRGPHSLEYFGVARQYWWNGDFIALMSERWRLRDVRRALDVGCGVGHWTSFLQPLLPPDAEVVGLDREARWIEIAREVASAVAVSTGAARNVSFVEGAAETLPFPDASFDMVTCQTLLVHVADPVAVVTEMKRVLQPGGLLVIVEPNNLVQTLLANSVTASDDIETVLARVRLELTCERGRVALGEGDFSVGDRIARIVLDLGFAEVQTHLSDRAMPLLPPYAAEDQAALVAWFPGDGFSEDAFTFGREDAKRYFLAAKGGSVDAFDLLWSNVVETNRREHAAVLAREFSRPGGRLVYVVSARR